MVTARSAATVDVSSTDALLLPLKALDLKPGDEVMLVRYTESLDIRRQFTADLGTLDADIEAMLKLRTMQGDAEALTRHFRIPLLAILPIATTEFSVSAGMVAP